MSAFAEDADLSGTWNVTAKPSELQTCAGKTPKTKVEQWLLADDGGEVGVTILGNKTHPKVKGGSDGSKVILMGLSSATLSGFMSTLYSSVVYSLTVEDDALRGDLYISTVDGKGIACLSHYVVTAKQQ